MLIVLTVPDALVRPFDTSSPAAYVLAQALLAVAAVAAAVVLDRRAPRFPTGDGAEDWLARPGIELTVPVDPASVHDAALRLVSAAGLTVYLADRACGRVAAGSAEQLVLGVAAWAFGGGSRVRIVGAPHDVQRFADDLTGDLLAGPGAALRPTRSAGR